MEILKIALLLLQLNSGEVQEIKSQYTDDSVALALVEVVFESAATDGDVAAHGINYISSASGAPIDMVNADYLDCGYMDETARNFGEE